MLFLNDSLVGSKRHASTTTKLVDPPPANFRPAEVYGGLSWSKDHMAISNRADAVLLAHL